MRSHYALVTAMLFLACAPKTAETAEGSGTSAAETDGAESSETTPTTTPTTGDSTTGPGPTSATQTASSSAEESASSPGTISTSTSTSTSTDTGDETEGSAGLPGACAAVCMHWETCSPGSAGPIDECTANCLAGIEVPSECAMATAAQWDCVAGLACEEALKFVGIGDEPPMSCLAEVGNADQTCEDIGCNGEIGGGEETCELEQQCGDGSKENYACDSEANLCTCTENGVPGKQCPADGFCSKDRNEQVAAINACCGWDWQ